jgi:prepilin-type N-terminal cleavage/methylation domain-containing protein
MNNNSFIIKKPKGFTIIELLIVIAIIGILTGIAVPYYNDYIYDTRQSVLQQNMKNMRDVINQFRGDQGRGPFRVEVHRGGVPIHENVWAAGPNDSELVSGPIQFNSAGLPTRRTNIKYLPTLPQLQDPQDGSIIPIAKRTFPTNAWTIKFYDADGDGHFDVDTEFAYINNDGAAGADQFSGTAGDLTIYNFTGNPESDYEIAGNQVNPTILDYTNIEVETQEGTKY